MGSLVAEPVCPLFEGVAESRRLLDFQVRLVDLTLTLLEVVLEILHLLDGKLLFLLLHCLLVRPVLVLFVDLLELLQLLT